MCWTGERSSRLTNVLSRDLSLPVLPSNSLFDPERLVESSRVIDNKPRTLSTRLEERNVT